MHTETINGKGVLGLYNELKRRGHKVTIASVPLLVENNKILYDQDINYTKKFNASDVIFPCGIQAPYQRCNPISQSDNF